MNKKNKIESIMHFLVHNSFLFTVAIMCLVHATLLIISLVAEVPPLVYYNILSVIIYIFCILLCKFGHIMPVYVSIFLEVTVYTVYSIFYIGWDCGSCCFLCSIIPIMIYSGCLLFKGSKRWIVVLIVLFIFALYVFLFLFFGDVKPVYEVTSDLKKVLIVFSSFAMIFSVVFYNMVYIYSSEYEMVNLEQKNQQLSADAKEDALTGLLNRRGFLPIVEALINSEQMSHFCIAFCDLDNFKRINDSFGHECGDEVLRHVTNLIKKEMHGCNICRWGGEEIIILMKDYDFAVAKQKMEYIRMCVENTPTVFFNKRISATITIGLEEYKEAYHDPDDIINVADERMYYGKQHGKNIVISSIDPDNA